MMRAQAGARGMLARNVARKLRSEKAALLIQTTWRMAIQRFHYQSKRTAVLRIQSAYRGHVARATALDLRSASCPVSDIPVLHIICPANRLWQTSLIVCSLQCCNSPASRA